MKKILIFLSAMSVLYCASPVDIQTRSSEDETTDEIANVEDSTQMADSLAQILTELPPTTSTDSIQQIFEDLGIEYPGDSIIIDNGFIDIYDTTSTEDETPIDNVTPPDDVEEEGEANNQFDDIIQDYLQNDEFDSSAIQDILDSLEIEDIDSSNIKSVIDAALMSSSDQAFQEETITVSGMTQVLTLNEETIGALFGEDVEVPEGFTYDMPVIISFSGDSPVVYVPVGEGSDITPGQLVTLEGREQIDSGEDQSGFTFLLIE